MIQKALQRKKERIADRNRIRSFELEVNDQYDPLIRTDKLS